jgi:hypothetical protein
MIARHIPSYTLAAFVASGFFDDLEKENSSIIKRS